jgi:hypothetical protein
VARQEAEPEPVDRRRRGVEDLVGDPDEQRDGRERRERGQAVENGVADTAANAGRRTKWRS